MISGTETRPRRCLRLRALQGSQRQAAKDAGTIAGLTVLPNVNEPAVDAIACGLHKKAGESQISQIIV